MSDEETMENEAITYYFENSGEQNTDKVLEVTNARALERKVKNVVVASTHGEAGIKPLKPLKIRESKSS